ncbi:hypothetical protein OHV08_01605 [Streptomyces canus]
MTSNFTMHSAQWESEEAFNTFRDDPDLAVAIEGGPASTSVTVTRASTNR